MRIVLLFFFLIAILNSMVLNAQLNEVIPLKQTTIFPERYFRIQNQKEKELAMPFAAASNELVFNK